MRCLRKAGWKDGGALRQPPAMCTWGQCTALPRHGRRLVCRGAVSLQKNDTHGHSLLLSQVALKASGKSRGGSPVLQHFLLEL